MVNAVSNKISLEEVKGKLDEYLVGLDEQKEQLISIFIKHYSEKKDYKKGYRRSVVLLTGPSGSGKTAMVNAISEIMNKPFFSLSCATVTAEGYKGTNLSQHLGNFYESLKRSDARFRDSVLFLDEFDKVITNTYQYQNASMTDQQAFLNLFDSNTYTINSERNPITLDTSNMLIILAGAFTGLKEKMSKNETKFGLVKEETVIKNKQDRAIELTEGLRQFGFVDEIVGRISMCIEFPAPTKEVVKQALSLENGLLNRWKCFFNETYNTGLSVTNEARDYISSLTISTPFGMRGMSHFLQPLLNDAIVELERDLTINKISVQYDEGQGLYLAFKHGKERRKQTSKEEKYFICH